MGLRKVISIRVTSIFPFVDPVTCENGDVIEVKCVICSWRSSRDVKQLKKDTIEKHCGKIYYKENFDGKVENKSTWKNAKECKHVENAEKYEKKLEMIIVSK